MNRAKLFKEISAMAQLPNIATMVKPGAEDQCIKISV